MGGFILKKLLTVSYYNVELPTITYEELFQQNKSEHENQASKIKWKFFLLSLKLVSNIKICLPFRSRKMASLSKEAVNYFSQGKAPFFSWDN